MEHLQLHQDLPSGVKTMIAAFSGWSDAGEAGTQAVRYLRRIHQAQLVAEIDPEEFYDFTSVRPLVYLDPEGERRIRWPSNRLHLVPAKPDQEPLLLFRGIEPGLRWRTYASLMADLAKQCGVQQVIFLSALLNAVPHTRAIRVTGSGSTPALQEKLASTGVLRRGGTYQGPTGVTSVVTEALRERGIDYASFWGSVPHYIQAFPNPQVSKALLERLSLAMDISVDLTDLEVQAEAFHERCEQAIAQEAPMKAYVRRLEQHYDEEFGHEDTPRPVGPVEMPDPQELVKDLEQFLRSQREPGEGPSSG